MDSVKSGWFIIGSIATIIALIWWTYRFRATHYLDERGKEEHKNQSNQQQSFLCNQLL